jgi:hypothetical protein
MGAPAKRLQRQQHQTSIRQTNTQTAKMAYVSFLNFSMTIVAFCAAMV